MTCVVCHGEEVRLQHVQEDILMDNDVVAVPIRTLVFHFCGERYYDRPTIRHLEDVEKELRAGQGPLKKIGKVLTYG